MKNRPHNLINYQNRPFRVLEQLTVALYNGILVTLAVLGTGYENTRHTRGNDEPGTAPYKFVGYFTRPTVF